MNTKSENKKTPRRRSERGKWGQHYWGRCKVYVFVDRGTLGVLPLTYVYHPKSARAYLLSQSVKRNHYFAAAPFVSTPCCPQPRRSWGGPWPSETGCGSQKNYRSKGIAEPQVRPLSPGQSYRSKGT